MQGDNTYYNGVERIVDCIYYLGNGASLNIAVEVHYNDMKDTRTSIHKEYGYTNFKKYQSNMIVRTLKREIKTYLTLDIKDAAYNKNTYRIVPQDMIRFENILNDLYNKMYDRSAFGYEAKTDKPIVMKNNTPHFLRLFTDWGNIPINISLEPAILYENDDSIIEGIILKTPDMEIPLNKYRLEGLFYIIKKLDLIGYAQNMLNYLGRPPYIDIQADNEFYKKLSNKGPGPDDENCYDSGVTGRVIPATKNRSYFDIKKDNMSDLE